MFILEILLYLIYFTAATLKGSQYNVDIIEIEWNVTTTNNFDMFWKLSQPTRGVFAMSGFLDFKQDINTNKAIGNADVYYSPNAISYMLTPYRIPQNTFTNFINFEYKEYLMDSLLECCQNPIDFKGKFVSPLTKRRIICENCLISGDNYPTHLRMGFYRIVFRLFGDLAFSITLTLKLEEE